MKVGLRDEGVAAEMARDPYRIRGLPLNTVIDIGANIGGFALYVQQQNPQAGIWAYEALWENFLLLCANVRRVNVHHVAVWEHNNGVLLTSDHSLSHVCLDPATCTASSACNPYVVDKAPPVFVPSITLDYILEPHTHVDLLKIDTEGAEYQILHAVDNDQLCKVSHLRMEIHDYFGDPARRDLWTRLSELFGMAEYDFIPGRGGIWTGDRL